jgi:hypothetical protein
MSMVFEARMLSAARAEQVAADPSLLEDLVEEDTPGQEFLDLDKAWHGVHWLLTGSVDETTTPEGQAVLGGTEVGDDWGYGPPRLLRPDDVRRVAAALEAVTAADLRARFDPAAMTAADVYPFIWDEEDVFEEYLAPSYETLRDFYSRAAARGDAVLAVLT